jgi:hypothetical protein
MNINFEGIAEAFRAGDMRELPGVCDMVIRRWKDIPLEPLIELKVQLARLGLEHREAHLDEALISIAEKRPGPFSDIASNPDHPLWKPAIEIMSMCENSYFKEQLSSLLPVCPKRCLGDLIRAISRCGNGAESVWPFLMDEDEGVFLEAVMAVREAGGPESVRRLKEAMAQKKREGSPSARVLEAVLQELERQQD